jgi:hypothetical protein
MTELEQAVFMIYESVKQRLPINFNQFKDALKDWEFVPLTQNGQIIGAVMLKENEIHIGYGIKPRASIKKHIKQTLNNLLDKYGEVVTSVQKDNDRGLAFCKRLNFIQIGQENDKILLKCERSKYA